MSEEINEQVSALMDGELSMPHQAEVIDQLLAQWRLARTWERYHLISDVLRNNLCEAALRSLSTTGLDAAAPDQDRGPWLQQSSDAKPKPYLSLLTRRVHESVSKEPLLLTRRKTFPLKPVAGLALVASLAGIAVLGVQSVAKLPAPPTKLQVAQATPPPPQEATLTTPHGDLYGPAVKARLSSYLVNYSEFLDNGMRGLLPYARIVSYDANQQ